ncbi:MAG: prolipoprotein diacylglyceryl transferase [Ruminococcaceae bacterium]|nr:prolipoprotein diacylglyceryl transferase [Oscillospiraceae bacterium]
MENIVKFPALNLEFKIRRIAFSLFNIDIYWYAIIIACGILLAFIYCSKEAKRQGMDNELFIDILLWGIPSGVIGGRLYYVIFKWEYYSKNLGEIFAIRDGGLAIYGAIIFAVLAVYIYTKKNKINTLKVFDIGAIGLLIGQAVGRWGNFFNQEAFGGNTSLLWGMTSEKICAYLEMLKNKGINVDPTLPVHPTFLYESLWNLAGVIIFNYLIKRKKFDGQIFFLYIIWYGFGRMLIEGLRTDSLYFLGFRISQIIGALSVVFGTVLYILLRKKGVKNG